MAKGAAREKILTRNQLECELFDAHCHLWFASNALQVADGLEEARVLAVSATVLPQEYSMAKAALGSNARVAVALGLHPWWVDAGRQDDDLQQFSQLIDGEGVVGEVGLDFSDKRKGTKEAQLCAFRGVLACINECAAAGHHKVVFLHAVKSTSVVMDEIARAFCKRTPDNIQFVFHRFAGSSQELARAAAAGFHFSVNLNMLNTAKGAQAAAQIPRAQLLLETDQPSQGCQWSAQEWRTALEETVFALAEIRDEGPAQLACALTQNARALLGAN